MVVADADLLKSGSLTETCVRQLAQFTHSNSRRPVSWIQLSLMDRVVAADIKRYQKTFVVVLVVLSVLWAYLVPCQFYGHSCCPVSFMGIAAVLSVLWAYLVPCQFYGHSCCPVSFMGIAVVLSVLWAKLLSYQFYGHIWCPFSFIGTAVARALSALWA